MNAISVIDIGGFWPAKIRESVEAAAARWGADLIVTRQDLLPRRRNNCYWFNKYVLRSRLTGYDAVLQLDGDMMISEAAPSPFEVHEPGKIAAVAEYQPQFGSERAALFWRGPFQHVVRKWARLMEMPGPPTTGYLNGGFLLYTPSAVADAFAEIMHFGAMVEWGATGLSDQTIVSILAYNEKLSVQRLPAEWNALHAGSTGALCGPTMDAANIYHFCGSYNRAGRVARVDWRLHETRL